MQTTPIRLCPRLISLLASSVVGHDCGYGPGEYGGQVRVVVRHGVDDETVHTGPVHGRHVLTLGVDRHQVQALPGAFARERQAFEEAERRGVAERVGQVLGEQEADRPGLPRPQRPGDRVRARISQAPRGLQHPAAKLGRELVWPVVRIGYRGPGDPQFRRQRGQRRWSPHMY
jgi:hypothetical protein